jgi:preprotein translocase subunit SecA
MKQISILSKEYWSRSNRYVRKLRSVIDQINSYAFEFSNLTDEQCRLKTVEFKNRISAGSTLDDILPEAFALVKEAAWRTLGMKHFDVQLMGGIVLHRGSIAEMKTGEGKTLVSTLPSYLNTLGGNPVHMVTVNEYLAKRDSDTMRMVHEFLGVSVGCVNGSMGHQQRQAAYASDITYGTNSEFGFDYLRDNMKIDTSELVQRGHAYAIIDEVDSVLIDEARTPLIISGETQFIGRDISYADMMTLINNLVVGLELNEDYQVEEKDHAVFLTDIGMSKLEIILADQNLLASQSSLYDMRNTGLLHSIQQAMRAHTLFKANKDYVIVNKEIVIIDEFTGRKMHGRRYSDGLHAALEAKEHVPVQQELQTVASVTLQNYFRLYNKISGMTGTAQTEEVELREIYGLDVIVIPTNKKMIRKDHDDEVYRTLNEKNTAIIKLVKERHAKGQPILIGTTSVEKSVEFSELLNKAGIAHNLLNAKNHEKEADIIADAGMPGAVTLATNMAGRGTDIQLGGNVSVLYSRRHGNLIVNGDYGLLNNNDDLLKEQIAAEVKENKSKVLEAGGLYVICTERHESRRIDNQLRGRAGRQGDIGESKFFLSLEDDLMRVFGSETLNVWLQRLGLQPGEAITHPWVNKSLEKAQQKIEGRNYSSRKNLVQYDNVMDYERRFVYKMRSDFMNGNTFIEDALNICHHEIELLVARFMKEGDSIENVNLHVFCTESHRIFGIALTEEYFNSNETAVDGVDNLYLGKILRDFVNQKLTQDQELIEDRALSSIYKSIFIKSLDELWQKHLLTTDHLRSGIHLRSYGQKDPVIEYKRESLGLFEEMILVFYELVSSEIMHYDFSNIDNLENSDDDSDFDLDGFQNQIDFMNEMLKNLKAKNASLDFGNTDEKLDSNDVSLSDFLQYMKLNAQSDETEEVEGVENYENETEKSVMVENYVEHSENTDTKTNILDGHTDKAEQLNDNK